MYLNSFTISFLNCFNLKSNLPYCNFLINNSNICYLNELSTKKSEFNIFKNISSNKCHKNPSLYQSDIPDYLKKSSGRPYQGQCWFIDDSCEVID